MAIRDALLPEYDHELATTRRLLELAPEAEFAWKPHHKSMSLGELAGHIANLPFWCSMTLEQTMFDVDAGDGSAVKLQAPASRAALLERFDANVARARATLATRTDADMLAPWTLRKGAHEIFTLPRVSAIRTFVLNHVIHHRGQLSVYLRLKEIPLPSVYGPTADEQ